MIEESEVSAAGTFPWTLIIDTIGIIYLALMVVFPGCLMARIGTTSTLKVLLSVLATGFIIVLALMIWGLISQ